MAKTYKIGQHLYQGTNNDTLVDIDNYYSKPIALEDYKIINTIRDNNGYYTIIQLEMVNNLKLVNVIIFILN